MVFLDGRTPWWRSCSTALALAPQTGAGCRVSAREQGMTETPVPVMTPDQPGRRHSRPLTARPCNRGVACRDAIDS